MADEQIAWYKQNRDHIKEVVEKIVGASEYNVSEDVNNTWRAACTLRGVLTEEHYKYVVLPMHAIRVFECAIADTRDVVYEEYQADPDLEPEFLYEYAGHQMYNTSNWTLKKIFDARDGAADALREYIAAFDPKSREIIEGFGFDPYIDQLDKANILLPIIRQFSEFDYSPENMPPERSGAVFEGLLNKFNASIMTGEHYTPRNSILLMALMNIISSPELRIPGKKIAIADPTCGTGGMLTVFEKAMKFFNPDAHIEAYGQELSNETAPIGQMELLIRGIEGEVYHDNTLMNSHLERGAMTSVFSNPPFGTAWAGDDTPIGQEEMILAEGDDPHGRFPGGLPGAGDSQLLFMELALDLVKDNIGRVYIVQNGSALFNGGTSSGDSQIRRWLIENDYIDAIIKLPNNIFYNTGITTYIWVVRKDKHTDPKRVGKIQLIDASNIYYKLRKGVNERKNDFSADNIMEILDLYMNYEENELSQIHDKDEFLYHEYTVKVPLRQRFTFADEVIETAIKENAFATIHNPVRLAELEEVLEENGKLEGKDQKDYDKQTASQELYCDIIERLHKASAEYKDKVWYDKTEFETVFDEVFSGIKLNKAPKTKIMDALSADDPKGELQYDKNGDVIYNEKTKDTEIVPMSESIGTYMEREVLPYLPEAKAFDDENMSAKKPVIKTGSEIPFDRLFYKYETPRTSDDILADIRAKDRELDGMLSALADGE